jgi:TRAP-type C4-dicarboxylate transport system substrate-binding protein
MPQYNFVGRGDAPKSLKDFEGMRVRALGGVGAAMKTIGAVPTTVTASETYQAIESGTVQAASFAPHAHLAFKTVEAGKWYTTNLNPGTVNCPVVANTDALAALSDDHKKALMDSIDESYAHYVANYAKLNEKFAAELDKLGIQKVTFSADELAAFKAAAGKPNWDKWLADMKKKGVPGEELFKLVQDNLK